MSTPVSPKVVAATLAATLAAAVLTAIQSLAGDTAFIAALPTWTQPLIPGLTAALAAAVSGYIRRDHLRDMGHAALTDTTVPDGVTPDDDAFDDDTPLDH